MKPGIYHGIPNDTYHADRNSLSVSGAKTLVNQTPAHFKHQQNNKQHKAVFDFGTAAHSLALEGDTTNLVIVDAANWMTKAAKEERATAYLDGKTPLLTKEFEQVTQMAAVLRDHDAAAMLLQNGTPEVSAYFEHSTGITRRARFDWLPENPAIIPDYKTAVSADISKFQRSVADYGYHMQADWYMEAIKTLGLHPDPSFVFVVQEKTAPYLVNVIELDVTALAYGRQLNERALTIFAECQTTGNWPGYPLSDPIPLPRYAEYDADRILENE